MSNPVTNIEIEDVLSSIRRLVADGDKLRSSAADPAEQAPEPLKLGAAVMVPQAPRWVSDPDADPDPVAERFVLTPSLRVDADGSTDLAIGSGAQVPDTAELSEPPVLLWDEPETPSQADAMEPTSTDTTEEGGPLLAAELAPRAAVPERMPAPSSDPWAYVTEGRSRLESTIAELEAAITGQSDEFEPDGSEAMPQMDWTAGAGSASFLSSRSAAKPADIEDAEELMDKSVEASGQVVREADDLTGDLAEDLARSDPDTFDGELDETLTAYLEEDEILDEDTLRNLVIEIVRQELQGTLGERITRNVRKLVRREIYRALSSQELD